MMLENQQFRKWLRRPTIFVANAWYLMAAAGQTIVGYLVMLLAALLAAFGLGFKESGFVYLSSTLFELFVLAMPVAWYAVTHDGVDQAMRLNMPKPEALLLAGLTAVAGVIMSNNLVLWWMLLIESLGGNLYGSSIPIPTNAAELFSSIVLVGVIPGVCEELFFRGGLMGAWERRGTKQALLITSALFTLLHGTILGLPTQLIMGFVLGYILILSDSLFVCMFYHAIHNSVTMILAYLSAGEEAALEYLTLAEQVSLSGGFLPMIIQTVLSAALFAVLLMLMTRRLSRGRELEKVVNGDLEPMTWQELLVLIAGLLTVGLNYLTDLMTICGGI